MSVENPGPPNTSQHPTLPEFDIHPGDKRVIPDYMGEVMPPEDAARYAEGGDFDLDDQEPGVDVSPEDATVVERKQDERMTALDKLRVIREELGFLPLDRDELNEIWRIRQHLGEAGGSAKDLNILLLHQSNATKVTTDDPEALLRKKVHTWGGYFRQATGDRTLIKDVADFAAKYPNMTSAQVVQHYGKLVSYAPRALRPVKAVGVLDQLVSGDAIPANVARNPFEHVNDMWANGLEAVSRNELRATMILTNTMNNHRHDFWYSILAQARQHDTVKLLVGDYIQPERPPDR